MNRNGDPGSGPSGDLQPSEETGHDRDMKRRRTSGSISTIHYRQSSDAVKLCIYDAGVKLNEAGDYHIGGTYSGIDPELWFFFTSSLCHGNNRLLNLFVHHRQRGNIGIQLSDSNELVEKKIPGEDVPHLVLPSTLTKPIILKSTKPNQTYYLKTYCFSSELDLFNSSGTLFIPIKLTSNPQFTLESDLVKTIKLRHDLSALLRKQEKTDFILKSATNKQFPTHRILLAAHSPVLRKMIKNPKMKSLAIDVSDNDMELLLQFIYTGTIVDVTKQDCVKLLEIADKFQLKPLFTLTQHVISGQISVSNAVEMAVIAKKYELDELLNKVLHFIIKNPEVLQTEAWNNLKDVELTKYLFQYMQTMKE